MNVEISEDALRKTERCPRGMQCLKNGGRPECRVERMVVGNGVFVYSKDFNICSYRISHARSYVCICPVRIELFQRYKI